MMQPLSPDDVKRMIGDREIMIEQYRRQVAELEATIAALEKRLQPSPSPIT